MKQLWSAVILLGAMVLLLTWNAHELKGLIRQLQLELDQAVLAVQLEDWQEAEELTRSVSDQWQEKISYLHLVQSHRDMDEVSILLDEAMQYISAESSRTYLALNARIQGVMDGIYHLETVSLENLI